MASILCGKTALQKNQQAQALVWKTTVVKPFPTHVVQNKVCPRFYIRKKLNI
jgi:hypothetical protein